MFEASMQLGVGEVQTEVHSLAARRKELQEMNKRFEIRRFHPKTVSFCR